MVTWVTNRLFATASRPTARRSTGGGLMGAGAAADLRVRARGRRPNCGQHLSWLDAVLERGVNPGRRTRGASVEPDGIAVRPAARGLIRAAAAAVAAAALVAAIGGLPPRRVSAAITRRERCERVGCS